jgi:hypothetical protein
MNLEPALVDELARCFAEAAVREMLAPADAGKENAIASEPGRGDGIASGELNDTIQQSDRPRQVARS